MLYFSGKRFRIRDILISSLFVIFIGYFAYHAIHGQRGLTAMISLTQQIETAKKELDTIRSERIFLEHRVSLLRPESLDLDLLDERARASLGYASEGEEVYLIERREEVSDSE